MIVIGYFQQQFSRSRSRQGLNMGLQETAGYTFPPGRSGRGDGQYFCLIGNEPR